MADRPQPAGYITREDFDALLFDLDGVVTSTADLHAKAWKRLFDEYLEHHARAHDQPFEPFYLPDDYLDHVDGKPRQDGVRDFLASRGMELPLGTPDDAPGSDTIWALGVRKNGYYHELLDKNGARVFDSSVAFVRKARVLGFSTAVVSSSRNCERIITLSGLNELFDTRFDGNDLAEHGMPGKPDPGMFLAAAKQLGVKPERAVVFEDAVSGVEAGRRGGFGLVVGVNRGDQAEELAEQGADVVVEDLEELQLSPDGD